MTKCSLTAVAACLILAATSAATAQTAPAPTDVSVTSEPLRAGGAAGYPATPNAFERLWADLGFTTKSDESEAVTKTVETQTADAR